ncbi:MAG: double-strand break repair protein AddB, partial [Pseudomonadota bacterium]
ALARAKVLVPTRRATRGLSDAFRLVAERQGVRASLAPQIRPIGDVDEEEAYVASFANDLTPEALPPAISPMQRLLTLARFVSARDRAFRGSDAPTAALQAAKALAGLLDSLYTEEIDFSLIEDLAPEEHAEHWRRSASFLEIVTTAWPAHLHEIGRMDPTERRIRLINALAERWRTEPPTDPVIIAGTTGSTPSVARLMAIVSRAPNGAVVLPGFERPTPSQSATKAWRAIDDPHPQAGMKALLKSLDIDPATVRDWPGDFGAHKPPAALRDQTVSSFDDSADNPPSDFHGARQARRDLLALALRPAEATDDWRTLIADASEADPDLIKAVTGLNLVEANDEDNEATAIAILMRETLETPGKTALLVTPDRDLGRRVSAKLKHWAIDIDDSGGVPLQNTVCGVFLRLVADFLAQPTSAVALMALLRHPYAQFGLDDAQRKTAIAALDRGLRGARPLGERIDALWAKLETAETLKAKAAPLLNAAEKAIGAPLTNKAPFRDHFDRHLKAAEHIASTPDKPGAERLWAGVDGAAAARSLEDIKESADIIPPPEGEYPSLFAALISGPAVRNPGADNARLAILGPLEARLIRADRMILGGLNEGVWPGDAGVDPFLSRAMRAALGLPSLERRIGLGAHDFAQAAAAPDVWMTRATRAGGAPTKPSRWIVRLTTILNGAGAQPALRSKSQRVLAYAASLNKVSAATPAEPPTPRPPAATRPKTLPVTQIEKLIRDPYSVYARYVLGLKKLDGFDEQAGPRELGSLMHAVFEAGAQEKNKNLSTDFVQALLNERAARFGVSADDLARNAPSLDAAIAWFCAWSQESASEAAIHAEESGEMALTIGGETFTLHARADRIEDSTAGGVRLIDYKLSTLPSLKTVLTGFSPQLTLTALIAAAGGFPAIKSTTVQDFRYMKILNRSDDPKKNEVTVDGAKLSALLESAEAGLIDLLTTYADPETPFLSQPRRQYQNQYGDYDVLARRREWDASTDDKS